MTLSEELSWRGFVGQTTYADPGALDAKPLTFYWGVDPSADSMTIGNLAAAMMVRHFIDHGHKAILLIGGATGMIGDPDGKKQERELLSPEEIAKNKAAITKQYRQIFAGQDFDVVDNYDWFKGVNYLSFLRDIGKHMPMRLMLGREFVQSRLSDEGSGISYAEFSYSLIQGYDFLHLYRNKGVTLQLSGADQWGNSITGVELIRRIEGGEANIWTSPLVLNKTTGVKFGKTEEDAIWLDENKTSVYKFYQFWFNVDDAGVMDYLKIYTLLSPDEIKDIGHNFAELRSARDAQRVLAYEVTSLIHGKDRADSVKRVSEALFGGRDYTELSKGDFEMLKSELPSVTEKVGADLAEVLVKTELASSKGEARRFLEASAVYINGSQFSSDKTTLTASDAIDGFVILRRGKNSLGLVELS